jgi:hypothetical protein
MKTNNADSPEIQLKPPARAERFVGATGATLDYGGNRAFYWWMLEDANPGGLYRVTPKSFAATRAAACRPPPVR